MTCFCNRKQKLEKGPPTTTNFVKVLTNTTQSNCKFEKLPPQQQRISAKDLAAARLVKSLRLECVNCVRGHACVVAVMPELLKPTSDKIGEIQEFREKNRRSTHFNHLSGISESIPALGWVAVVKLLSNYEIPLVKITSSIR